MKKGYWVAAYRAISNGEALKAYAALAIPAVDSFGGRLLTGPMSQVEPHEAGLQLLTIIVEFESYDRAVVAYKSEAYRKALDTLGSGAERDFRIVEGV